MYDYQGHFRNIIKYLKKKQLSESNLSFMSYYLKYTCKATPL